MEKDRTSRFNRNRYGFSFGYEGVSNADLFLVAMGQHGVSRARGNLETAVFHRRVCDSEPDRDKARVIGFLKRHAHILMPVRCGDVGADFRTWQGTGRGLDAHMLNRIGSDLRPDQTLDRIEDGLVSHHLEYGRPDMHRWCRFECRCEGG